jgi:uncharacterized protein (TIGR03437 family)
LYAPALSIRGFSADVYFDGILPQGRRVNCMGTESSRAAQLRLIVSVAAAILLPLTAPAASTDISFTPATLAFKYQVGAALPAAQALQIKSTGAAFAFTVAVTGPAPYNGKWLSVSANSGTTAASLKVYVNPTGMPAGTYSGSIVVTSSSASNSPATAAVTLEVGAAPATLAVAPGTLSFTWVSGQPLPTAQTVVLSSNGVPLSAAIGISGTTWLKAQPSGNIALLGLPGTVSVSVDPTGLNPGSYTGKITFTSSTASNKSVTVDVSLTVNAGVPTATAVWPAGVGINSPATTVTITGTSFFSTTVAYSGTTALTTVVLSPTTLLATIPAALLTAGNLSLTVQTPAPGGGTSAPALTFAVYPAGPQIQAVANVASYNTSGISPGELVTIYGSGLGPANLTVFSPQSGTIATSLPATGAATTVTIDGTAAPLLYTSANQVSCIVPFAVAAKVGQAVNVTVTYNSVTSAAVSAPVVAAVPGVFTLDASGSGQGAILNYNSTTGDYTVNGTGTAAQKGATVVLYATGFGQTNPAGNEGQLITGTVAPVGAVALTIGGQSATVQAAVSPVGSVPGVLQVNATVPATVATGAAIPVVLSVGGVNSQTVTMVVK